MLDLPSITSYIPCSIETGDSQMDYTTGIEKVTDRLLEGIRVYQELTLAAAERAGKTFGDFAKASPLPRPRTVAETAFKAWDKLAENNREFTLKLLDALYPKADKND
jgi:hypothetical protein